MKFLIYVGLTIGGIIGSYVPVIFGNANPFSGWSLLFGMIGSFCGVWISYKVYQNFLD